MPVDKKKVLGQLRLAWKLATRTTYLYKVPSCTLNPSLFIFEDKKFECLLMDENGSVWLEMTVSLDCEDPLGELQNKLRNLGYCFKLTGLDLIKKYPDYYNLEINDSIIEEATTFCRNLYFSVENVKNGTDALW